MRCDRNTLKIDSVCRLTCSRNTPGTSNSISRALSWNNGLISTFSKAVLPTSASHIRCSNGHRPSSKCTAIDGYTTCAAKRPRVDTLDLYLYWEDNVPSCISDIPRKKLFDLQTIVASTSSQPMSQMVLHLLFTHASTRPS